MKLRFVAPIVGLMLVTGCAGDAGPSGPGRAAPIVPTVAAIKSMDDADRAFMTEQFAKAMDHAMTNHTVTWTNPSSGNQVQVTPTRTYQPENNNRYCREFTQSISEKGQGPATRGTACQQSDGSWQIVS
jgi:surface antigen